MFKRNVYKILTVFTLCFMLSCSSRENLKNYKLRIQDCIDEKLESRADQFGFSYYKKEEGGLQRVLHEFEETLLKLGILKGKSKTHYLELIETLSSVGFDVTLQSQKLNSISELYGLFNIEYIDSCPALTLTEGSIDRKVKTYKLMMEELIYKGGVPDKIYLEEFIPFVDFDISPDRLFFTYLIFLQLKYR